MGTGAVRAVAVTQFLCYHTESDQHSAVSWRCRMLWHPDVFQALVARTPADLTAGNKNQYLLAVSRIGRPVILGLYRPKLQLLNGHSAKKSLAVYRDLALSDVAEEEEYEEAMRTFPV